MSLTCNTVKIIRAINATKSLHVAAIYRIIWPLTNRKWDKFNARNVANGNAMFSFFPSMNLFSNCSLFIRLKNKLCLSKHMVQHSSIRYNCELCEYSALNRQCLRNHMRVQHTNDKPFVCDDCGKAFKLKVLCISFIQYFQINSLHSWWFYPLAVARLLPLIFTRS